MRGAVLAECGKLIAALLIGSCCLPIRAGADDERPAKASAGVDSARNERSRLWQQANQAASAQKWSAAAKAGAEALAVHQAHFADQLADGWRMMNAVAYWHSKAREFPAALTAAKELESQQKQLLGPEHWCTVDARLNVAFYRRISELSDVEWRQLGNADELHVEATRLLGDGKRAESLQKLRQALPLYEKILGIDRPVTLSCLTKIVRCEMDFGQYFAAHPHLTTLMEHQPKVHGTVHPEMAQGLQLLAQFNDAVGDLATAEEAFRRIAEIQEVLSGPDDAATLQTWIEVGRICSDRGKLVEARPLVVDNLRKQQKLFGKEHPTVGQSLKVIGILCAREKRYAEGEKYLNESLAILRKAIGEDHPATAGALNGRGRLYLDSGRVAEADADFRAALRILRDALGESHPTLIKVLDNQARLFETLARSGEARELRLYCLKLAEDSFGEHNPQTAEALEHVARVHVNMNDYGLAEYYLARARETWKRRFGEGDPRTARVSGQLAYVLLAADQPQRAKPLFLTAITTLEKATDQEAIASRRRFRKWLAQLYQSTGRLAEAERTYRQVLQEATREDEAVAAADVKIALAQTLVTLARGDEAQRLCGEAFQVYDRVLPPDDPHWIDPLGIRATAALAVGDAAAAEQLLLRALQVAQNRLQNSSVFESERQRLAQSVLLRNLLDLYLSLPESAGTRVEKIYPHVLAWKGGVAARQWRDRQRLDVKTAKYAAELQQINQVLATLTLKVPRPEERRDWTLRIFQLNMRKESVEQQLAMALNHDTPNSTTTTSLTDLRRVLPTGTALVDTLYYTQTTFQERDGKREAVRSKKYLAFVLRPERELIKIDLGEAGPIAEAVTQWQKSRGFRPNAGKKDWGVEVGRLIWQPLSPHLHDCPTVLISPDGSLGHVAWNMLPGQLPGSYLIEDHGLCVVSIPQLLPEQLRIARRDTPPAKAESLLVVGGVDYDASPVLPKAQTISAGSRGDALGFTPLPGTVAEVAAIRDLFQSRFANGRTILLEGATATEAAFRREAPQHRWLHIATHGFFAPAGITSAIAAQKRMDPSEREQETSNVSIFHVGFLNGLALTGANVGASGEGDDGILTAAELATLDLRQVDVAVLSGCETGLGELQDGEGSFGLQRALQIAGVRSTLGSLWTVSDEKTNLLMHRFYANLWDKRLSRLEALREAQLWMLKTSGKKFDPSQPAPAKRCSPHYWAAFTLSGDWR